jgi:hypothetical protein
MEGEREEEDAARVREKERDSLILGAPTELEAVVRKRAQEAEAVVVAEWRTAYKEQEWQYERQLQVRDDENAADLRGALDAAAGECSTV